MWRVDELPRGIVVSGRGFWWIGGEWSWRWRGRNRCCAHTTFPSGIVHTRVGAATPATSARNSCVFPLPDRTRVVIAAVLQATRGIIGVTVLTKAIATHTRSVVKGILGPRRTASWRHRRRCWARWSYSTKPMAPTEIKRYIKALIRGRLGHTDPDERGKCRDSSAHCQRDSGCFKGSRARSTSVSNESSSR